MTAPIPQPKHLKYSLQEQNVFKPLATRTEGYYDSYYPYSLREWNKLDPSLRSIDSLSKFKAQLIKGLQNYLYSKSVILSVLDCWRDFGWGFVIFGNTNFVIIFQIASDVYVVMVMKRLSISSDVAVILLTLARLHLNKCLTS